MPGDNSFDSLEAILGSIVRRLGLDAKLAEFRLRQHWSKIVGLQIAAHARPDRIRFKKLYLLVRDSVWLHHLSFLKPDLLARINAAAGGEAITDIVMRIGEFGPEEKELRDSTQDPKLKLSPLESRTALEHEAAAHAAAVKDPELRARLAAVMVQALSLPGKPRSPR